MTSDKESPTSVFERELPDAEVVISQPFWPAYLTAERIAKAKKLKLAITAGIGSDHVALQAAIKHGVTVAEVDYSNSISVSDHVVMMILSLVRNYIPSYQWVIDGGWNIAEVLRSRSDGGRYGCGGTHRLGRSETIEAVRRQASLHRSASTSGQCGEGAGPHLSPQRRITLGVRCPSRHDPAHLRDIIISPDPLRGWNQGNPGCWFKGRPIRDEYLIVDSGKLVGTGAHSLLTRDEAALCTTKTIR